MNPIVRGLRRVPQSQMRRDRVLDENEIRAIWTVADMSGTFGAFAQIALLTAQRRDKVLTMRWSDLDDDLGRISTAPREKAHSGQLLLPPLAVEIIRSQPVVAESPYVFTGRGIGPINGFTSEIHARCDGQGRPLGFVLAGGEVSDYRAVPQLLDMPMKAPKAMLAEKGYDSDAVREQLLLNNIMPVILPKANRRDLAPCDYRRNRDRNQVERLFNRLKQLRRIATRYDKTATSFLGFLCLAAVRVRLPHSVNRP